MLFRKLVLMGFSLAVALGCTSMPVQELSDARLTIRSAYDAGAEEHAKESLSGAEILLQRATRFVEEKRFIEAREAAIMARERASSARDIAILRCNEKTSGQPPKQ